jgi:hypothetical protein
MLYASRVSQQLEASAERFRAFAESERSAFQSFIGALDLLDSLDADELRQRLSGASPAGALPSEEWDQQAGLVVPFQPRFAHHRAAREWALARIAGVRTVAVDGSEIKPTKDYSLPIAAVQVAWFENPHQPDGRYVKDVAFEIIHPDELTAEHGDGFGIADQALALRRFQAEVAKLCERMTVLAQSPPTGTPPVAFFDGSLVVSFAGAMIETLGAEYIAGICQLLAVSEATRVPLVGYVDTSLAKDLTTLLAHLGGLPLPQRVPDSRLLDQRLAWGDRTRALVCARDDVLARYRLADGRDFRREVCFTYLKTNRLAPPARLDFPRWVLRAGWLKPVLDVVRAEVIVGNGYPYGIESADACAVLGSLDREHFYRLVQDFAAHRGIALRVVPKAASKRRRRG